MSQTLQPFFASTVCTATLLHPVLHRVRPQHTAESLIHTSRTSRNFIHISRTVQPSFVHSTCHTVCACCNTARQPIHISRILRNLFLSTNCAAILCPQECNKRSYLARILSYTTCARSILPSHSVLRHELLTTHHTSRIVQPYFARITCYTACGRCTLLRGGPRE